MPRTIDKLRGLLPGGNPGDYFINGKTPASRSFCSIAWESPWTICKQSSQRAADEDESCGVAARAHRHVAVSGDQ